MPDRPRVLILGGTAEAAALAHALAPIADITSSLAGRAGIPDLPGRTRVGGFGGTEGLRDYLDAEAFDAVIDATHPFAARITVHAVDACDTLGMLRLRLERPSWAKHPKDHWVMADDTAAASSLLPSLGRRAFLTVGTGEVAAFSGIAQMWFLVRLLKESPLPLEHYAVITGKPPFAPDDEVRLMRSHGIDVLVTKQAGGLATYGKIQAARDLDLPVLMIRRPPPPPGDRAETVAEAVAWLKTAFPRDRKG